MTRFGEPDRRAAIHATLDHTMLRVEDLKAALDWYTTHSNYVEHGRWKAETFTNVFLGPEDNH